MAKLFDYRISLKDIFFQLIPWFLRKEKFLSLLFSIAKPLQDIADDLYTFTVGIDRLLTHNSQVIYFEKYLNDIYDPTDRRITIQTNSTGITYIFNTLEGEWLYVYNLWANSISYVAGEFTVYDGVVYECILANTNIQPPHATYWAVDSDATYIFNKGDGFDIDTDFAVLVPSSITYNQDSMIADIEQYKLASKTYEIINI